MYCAVLSLNVIELELELELELWSSYPLYILLN